MKGVVMVSASFFPYIGGAEKQALELSAELRRRGLDVVIATRRLPGLAAQEEVQGVPVFRLACRGSDVVNAVTFMVSLANFLWRRRSTYDVIHVHLAGSPALTAVVMGKLLGKRVFVKLGGGAGIGELAVSARTLSGRLKIKALAWLKPQMLAVARELTGEARKYLGAVPVYVLPNGVDMESEVQVLGHVAIAFRRAGRTYVVLARQSRVDMQRIASHFGRVAH